MKYICNIFDSKYLSLYSHNTVKEALTILTEWSQIIIIVVIVVDGRTTDGWMMDGQRTTGVQTTDGRTWMDDG